MKTELVGRMPLDGGGEVVIVSRTTEMLIDIPKKSGGMNYFRGKSKADLLKANRMVAWGESTDGSIAFFECRVIVEQDGAA